MNYRSVLVAVDRGRGCPSRMHAAARIAAENDASLAGVWLKPELVPGVTMGEDVVTPVLAGDSFLRDSRETVAAVDRELRSPFDAAVAQRRLRATWSALSGDHEDELIAHARRHDLCVLPRSIMPAFGDSEIKAEQVAMQSGGPVLVLPESGFPANFGRKILVAWKESREAARVLRDAWPFLAAADEVHFLTAVPDGRREMERSLDQHLEAHGCHNAFFRTERDTGLSAAEIILRHIDMVGADMVVLGLFGRPRAAEFVLGGVSRDLLSQSRMPLLVSH